MKKECLALLLLVLSVSLVACTKTNENDTNTSSDITPSEQQSGSDATEPETPDIIVLPDIDI